MLEGDHLDREELLASLPADVREALALEGDKMIRAMNQALSKMPEDEARDILQKLSDAGILQVTRGPDMQEVTRVFDPLFRIIAEVARGDTHESVQSKVEEGLVKLEELGWPLTEPVHRIWAGEREPETLTAQMDANSTILVHRILELVNQPSRIEIIATLPPAVRSALELQGEAAAKALREAIEQMPEDEAVDVLEKLKTGGFIE